MEDRKTAVAVLVCMFLLMFWMEVVMAPYNRRFASPTPKSDPVTQTSQQSVSQPNVAQPNVAPVNNAATLPTTNAPAVVPVAGHPNAAQIKAGGSIAVDTSKFHISIANLGGRFSSAQLKQFKYRMGSDALLDLVVGTENSALPLGVQLGNINDEYVAYRLTESNLKAGADGFSYKTEAGQDLSLKLVGTLQSGIEITKSLVFHDDSYLIDINVSLSNSAPDGSKIWLEWTHFDSDTATNQHLNHNWYTILGADNSVKQLQLNQLTTPIMELGKNSWVSFADKYFMSTLIEAKTGADGRIGKEGNVYFTRLSGGDRLGEYHLFLGPKSHGDLAKTGFQLERNVDLGWFAFIALPLLSAIKALYGLLGNYGLAIILLTLLIKAIFLPLTITSFKSMQAMSTIQPEMKALRERIQDPNQLNKEIMALYKKHGVNPMGGCLPMLIQLPVFLGLYNSLNYSIELRHAPFALWIQDLSSPERLEFLGYGIPVMVLLMGASMFIQQLTTPSAADPQQKKIMLMMPIIFTISFIIFPFPSGLVLYWLVNNLISIIQQMHLRGRKEGGALQGTVIASVAIFGVGYVLTLL